MRTDDSDSSWMPEKNFPWDRLPSHANAMHATHTKQDTSWGVLPTVHHQLHQSHHRWSPNRARRHHLALVQGARHQLHDSLATNTTHPKQAHARTRTDGDDTGVGAGAGACVGAVLFRTPIVLGKCGVQLLL